MRNLQKLNIKAALSCLSLMVAVFFATALIGQGIFGTISGIITDPSGAVVRGAMVTVTNTATNVSVTLTTNSAGIYNASNLNPGTYRVQAEAGGFKTGVINNIVLNVAENPKESMKLQVGQSTQTVRVTSESSFLPTQQSMLNQTISAKQMTELPILGGNSGQDPWSLETLSAGVSQQVGEGGYVEDNVRINGGRPRMDSYLLDGTNVRAAVFGGPLVQPSPDTVAELQVLTNDFTAEYGNVSGGVTTITTKSGTNQFHGSAFEYAKNAALDAKNYFQAPNTPILPSSSNEYGGTLGGAIFKNKLFFFVDYQGVRTSQTVPLVSQVVPNAAFRNGDLSATTQLHNPNTGLPYANNQVPISPIAKALLALYPAGNAGPSPTVGGDYWNGVYTFGQTVARTNPRIDWNLTQKDHIFGVFHYTGDTNATVSGFPDANNFTTNPVYAVTAGWTHIFNSSLVNEFRYGYTYNPVVRSTNGYGQVAPSDFGIIGIPACNYSGSNGKCGPPTISIGGFVGVGGGSGLLIQNQGDYQVIDNVTKTLGKQTFTFGGNISHSYIEVIQPFDVAGSFNFQGHGTGNPFGDFLIGYLSQSNVQVQTNALHPQTWQDALYVQDDWKLTGTFTANLGLRWQYDPSWTAPGGQLATFNPYTLQWTQNGINGVPRGAIETHWKEFAPRVGFAWNPRSGLVFRGGYGITYPGVISHGGAGDANVSPNVFATTQIPVGTNIANLPPIRSPNINAPLTFANAEYTLFAPYQQGTQYFQQYNLTLDKQLGQTTDLRLSYTGSHGVHLPVNYGYNLCQQSAAEIKANPSTPGNPDSGAGAQDGPYCAPGSFNALGGFYGDYMFAGYWGISSSVYNAMQVTLQKAYSDGLSYLATFTWSQLTDDSSADWGGFGSMDVYGQDFYHRSQERSVSAGDVPLNLQFAPTYELPFGTGRKYLNDGWRGKAVGGWRVTAIYSLTSGTPVGINDGGFHYGSPARTVATRPTLVGDPMLTHRTLNKWFNTSAFDWSGTYVFSSNLQQLHGAANPLYAFGDERRFSATLRSPVYDNLNLSLQKELKLPWGDQTFLRLQGDAFDVFNHPIFSPPDGLADATFGQITSTRGGPRIMQLSAHLTF